MKYLLLFFMTLGFFLNGCSTLFDGQFVTKDGKESPFKPSINKYEPIQPPPLRE